MKEHEKIMREKVAGTRWVTESVLIERINERLASERAELKDMQMSGSPSFGHFYDRSDEIAERRGSIDLEAIGREIGVLAPDEAVAQVSALSSENRTRSDIT